MFATFNLCLDYKTEKVKVCFLPNLVYVTRDVPGFDSCRESAMSSNRLKALMSLSLRK